MRALVVCVSRALSSPEFLPRLDVVTVGVSAFQRLVAAELACFTDAVVVTGPAGASDSSTTRYPRRYVSVMARTVLIVSTVEHADDVLRAHVGGADTIKVVVPVVRQGVLDWLANDQQAFGRAERVAERTAEQLPGETVDAVAGEANVGLAIRDALATFPADEIVVAVRPDEEKGSSSRLRPTTRRNTRSKECPSAMS
jgi:hypothetical protein